MLCWEPTRMRAHSSLQAGKWPWRRSGGPPGTPAYALCSLGSPSQAQTLHTSETALKTSHFHHRTKNPLGLASLSPAPCHWEKLCRHQEEPQPVHGPIPHSPCIKIISFLSHRVPSCTPPAQLPFGALALHRSTSPPHLGDFRPFQTVLEHLRFIFVPWPWRGGSNLNRADFQSHSLETKTCPFPLEIRKSHFKKILDFHSLVLLHLVQSNVKQKCKSSFHQKGFSA